METQSSHTLKLEVTLTCAMTRIVALGQRLLSLMLIAGSTIPLVMAQAPYVGGAGMEDPNDAYMPGVVLVRFLDGRMPQSGATRTGEAGFDAVMGPMEVTRIRQAFPALEPYARKRPLSASMEWLRGVYEVTYSGPTPPDMVAATLMRDGAVEMAEPRPVFKTNLIAESAMAVPNDALYGSDQQYMSRLQLYEAWDIVKAESGDVIIAIVDVGLDLDHEDHAPNLWINPGETPGNNVDDDGNGYVDDIHGWNFPYYSADPGHQHNGEIHGNAVGGAANAATDNSVGIAGPAWNAKTMPVHSGCTEDPNYICYGAEGLIYAFTNGADIANLSWGSILSFDVVQAAVQAATDAGMLVIAAAGNQSMSFDRQPFYPAAYTEVLAVGATQESSDRIASISNFGSRVEVWAPGESVLVTHLDNTYKRQTGTSIASPIVAGVAALVRTHFSSWGPERVREHLRLTADNIDGANPSELAGLLGNGRVNAYRALTESEKPAVRMVESAITDSDGDGYLAHGERGYITTTFKNYGANSSNLTIGLENSDQHITLSTSSFAVGALNHGDSFSATFEFTVGPSAPRHHEVRLPTSITEGSFHDSPDLVLLTLLAYPRYYDHSHVTLSVSITDEGNIGHFHHWFNRPWPTFGVQASYRTPDNRLNLFYLLWEAGLVYGTGVDKIVSSIPSAANADIQDNDLEAKADLWPTSEELYTDLGYIQHGAVTMTESDSSAANLGVDIQLHSYKYMNPDLDNFILLYYTFTNTTSTDITGLHVGLYFDWAFHNWYRDEPENLVYDAQKDFGYVKYARVHTPRVGVTVLSPMDKTHYAAVDRDAVVADGFTNEEKWSLLTGGLGNTTLEETDVAQFIAVGPLDIGGSQSEDVVFAIVNGKDDVSILQHLDAARAMGPPPASEVTISVSPTSVQEGSGRVFVSVFANSNTFYREPLVLPMQVTGSKGSSAVDFAPVEDFDLAFLPNVGNTRGHFWLDPIDDRLDEIDETIVISSTHPLVKDSTILILHDNDAPPDGVELAITPAFVNENDGDTTITVTATVIGDTRYGPEKTLNLSVVESGASQTVGFTAVPEFFLTIPEAADFGTGSFVLSPENDGEGESDATITIRSDSSFVLTEATLVIWDDDGGRTDRDQEAEVLEFGVTPPFPNPASGSITFVLSSPGFTEWSRLRLYNVLGQEVAVPYEGPMRAGRHTLRFDGRRLPAGMYLYVFESRDARESGQLIIVR